MLPFPQLTYSGEKLRSGDYIVYAMFISPCGTFEFEIRSNSSAIAKRELSNNLNTILMMQIEYFLNEIFQSEYLGNWKGELMQMAKASYQVEDIASLSIMVLTNEEFARLMNNSVNALPVKSRAIHSMRVKDIFETARKIKKHLIK